MPESKKRKRKPSKQTKVMETENDALYENCAGLDVHQETVVACVLFGPLDRRPKKIVETFSTTRSGLFGLSDFLSAYNVTHVAMESTSVYWKPVWNVLEGLFTLLLLTHVQSKMFQVVKQTLKIQNGLQSCCVMA